jgi:hypothetical protein
MVSIGDPFVALIAAGICGFFGPPGRNAEERFAGGPLKTKKPKKPGVNTCRIP